MNWESLLPLIQRTLARLPPDWEPWHRPAIERLQEKANKRQPFTDANKRYMLSLFDAFDDALPGGYLTAAEGAMVRAFADLLEEVMALYSIGTWDTDAQAYTPQVGTEPCINVPWLRLLHVLRLLRSMGYSAHRLRDASGEHDDNDWSVLVERTDGLTEQEILNSWKRRMKNAPAALPTAGAPRWRCRHCLGDPIMPDPLPARKILVSCSWCGALVDVTHGPAACPDCDHSAGMSRLDCDCPRCTGFTPTEPPTEADVQAVLDYLERRDAGGVP